jgi:hypothetical protein
LKLCEVNLSLLLRVRQNPVRPRFKIYCMETDFIIESMDFISRDHFIAFFSNGTYVTITGDELRKRFADLIEKVPPDEDE